MYNYVRYRMPDDMSAEDIVSEAYMKAARSFSSFDPRRAKFSTWVISIARNCMISRFRKERPTVALDDTPQDLLSVPSSQEEVDNRILVAHLLSCLDDVERELVALRYHEGYRNVDIARMLRMNPSTVSTKLACALAKMRAAAERN